MRDLVFGVGINDADYVVTGKNKNGSQYMCPIYCTWKNMIRRCYSDRQPTYADVNVCKSWLKFSKFRSWMISKDWKGKELDKDLKRIGSKIYSESTCMFVPRKLNAITTDRSNFSGSYPIGVYLDTESGNFKAQISINGKRKNLGRFSSIEEAEVTYCLARSSYFISSSKSYCSLEIVGALLMWAEFYLLKARRIHLVNLK